MRTVASFLLFLHLFALGVAVVSNELSSPLEMGLRNTPGVVPYLKTLSMDLSYAFNFTFGYSGDSVEAMQDTAYWAVANLKLPDGSEKSVTMPEPGTEPRQRFRRYERLVQRAGGSLGTPSIESVLPQAIAARWVKETGAVGGTIRLVRRDLPSEPYQLPSNERTLYEARLLVSGGNVQLFKIESASDSAPAAAPSTGRGR